MDGAVLSALSCSVCGSRREFIFLQRPGSQGRPQPLSLYIIYTIRQLLSRLYCWSAHNNVTFNSLANHSYLLLLEGLSTSLERDFFPNLLTVWGVCICSVLKSYACLFHSLVLPILFGHVPSAISVPVQCVFSYFTFVRSGQCFNLLIVILCYWHQHKVQL